MTIAREIRESKVESDIRIYAKHRGWWQAKFVAPGKRGVPDRLFIRRGCVIFIEIKKAGETPTVQQARRHTEMREHGAKVYWVDNLNDAMEILF